MNIVKKNSFRSNGRLVNQSDDMYRVVIDMSCREFALFSQYKSRQENKDENPNSAAGKKKKVTLPDGEHNNRSTKLLLLDVMETMLNKSYEYKSKYVYDFLRGKIKQLRAML